MAEVRQDPDARARGDALRGLLEGIVAEVRLNVTPLDAEVSVDGKPAQPVGPQGGFLLNPGAHSILVTRDGYGTYEKDVWLQRGSRKSYTVVLQLRPPGSTDLPVPASATSSVSLGTNEAGSSTSVDKSRRPFTKRPGFWVMISVLAAAGVGAGVAVAVTRKDDSSPQCGTTGDCATTAGLTVGSF